MRFNLFEPRIDAHIRKAQDYLNEANLARLEHQVAAEHHAALAKMYAERAARLEMEINSALQAIVGHCDLLERGYPDPNPHRDLATVVRQAQRISALLEKLRSGAHERMTEVRESVGQAGIPPSPDVIGRIGKSSP